MSPAVLSLVALAVVMGFSLTARINIGVLAVALAWPIAMIAAGWKAEALMAVRLRPSTTSTSEPGKLRAARVQVRGLSTGRLV